jgi:hypothetical protein
VFLFRLVDCGLLFGVDVSSCLSLRSCRFIKQYRIFVNWQQHYRTPINPALRSTALSCWLLFYSLYKTWTGETRYRQELSVFHTLGLELIRPRHATRDSTPHSSSLDKTVMLSQNRTQISLWLWKCGHGEWRKLIGIDWQ